MDDAQVLSCACGSGLPAALCCDQDQAAITPVIACTEEVATALRGAVAVFNNGASAAAEATCLALLRQQPGLVTALHILADIRKIGRFYPAELALRRRIVTLMPDDLPQLVRFVAALVEHGNKDEALRNARRAIWLAPTDPRAQMLMALAFAELNRMSDAEYHLDYALAQTETPDPDVLLSLAEHMWSAGRVEKARSLIARAESIGGATARSVTSAAMTEITAGDLDAAEALTARAVRDWPASFAHSLPRATIAAQRGESEHALEILDSYGTGAMPAFSVSLRLLRGRLLGTLGRTDESFAEISAAKSLEVRRVRQQFPLERTEKFYADTRARLTPLLMSRLPSAPVRRDVMQPLFVVGFARSGTTMLEQSLSMHPRIAAGGELRATTDVVSKAAGMLGSRLHYPDALAEMLVADRRAGVMLMRDDYLNGALPNVALKPGAKWFTDKALAMEVHTPLRALMFPESPIVNIVRHPLDTVLSVFSHQFPDSNGYAATLEHTAQLYRLSAEAAEQWRLTLPQIRYMRIRYEDILADQEGEMRRLFDFIGEPFDPACLAFHENRRIAPTLSNAQVREKINNKARYRYKRYLKHLQPIIPILEPVIAMLGYEIEG